MRGRRSDTPRQSGGRRIQALSLFEH
jgi:hypothetical protein